MSARTPHFSWMTPILCVDDVPTSLTHYADVLGFQVLWSWGEEEAFDAPSHPTFACVARGEYAIFLSEKSQGNAGSWLCLNVKSFEELDQVHAEYRESGAKIIEPPTNCSWGMREMVVEDLDGNTFRIGAAIPEDASP